MHKNSDGKVESLIEKIVPSSIEDTSYFDQDIPYHLQPPSFSRSDLPTDYCYKPDQIQHRANYPPTIADTLESNLIGRNRARRPHNAYIVAYDKASIPMEAQASAVAVLGRYKNMEGKLQELKKVTNITKYMLVKINVDTAFLIGMALDCLLTISNSPKVKQSMCL